MLIGLCGGICAGKHEVARFLIDEYNFCPLRIANHSHRSSHYRHDDTPPNETNDNDDDTFSTSESTAGAASIATAEKVMLLPTFTKNEVTAFDTADDLLEYVTPRWKERFVIICTDIWSEEILEALMKRPFFILVSVDAPIVTRWGRYVARLQSRGNFFIDASSLESFIAKSDRHMYGHHDDRSSSSSSSSSSGNKGSEKLIQLMSRAAIRLINPTSSISVLREHLRKLEITKQAQALMRPSWDEYFMQLANLAAQRSNCMKRRVGAVIVRDKRVISTGYNGSPRGMTNCNDGGCKRCNDGAVGGVGLSTCLCMHAEENALLEAGRERIREGSILYCDTCPCLTCSIKIVQVGISEVVYGQGYSMDTETAAVLSEGGVKLRQFHAPKQGVISLGAK